MLLLNGKCINFDYFPNGELNILRIEEAIKLRKQYRHNHFVLKYESDKDLMALHFAKKHVGSRTGIMSDLSISYMPYSRMDREETPETPFMLKHVCDFINNLNFGTVYVHEPHSSITGQLLNNVVEVFDNINLVKVVMHSEKFNEDVDYLVFPDKGALERYNGKITSKNMLIGDKKRDFETGRILSLEVKGDFSKVDGSTAIIVDDLSSYGGTFVEVAQQLRTRGFNRVVLLVCHAENSIFKGKLFDNVDKIYTTDSILTEHVNWENQKFRPQLRIYGLIEQMKEENPY